jgi:hypothetical protein
MDDSFFKKLTPTQVRAFQKYAQTHDPDPKQWEIYHPVCRAEWIRLGKEPK